YHLYALTQDRRRTRRSEVCRTLRALKSFSVFNRRQNPCVKISQGFSFEENEMNVTMMNRGGFKRGAYDARNHKLYIEFESGRVAVIKAIGETLAMRFLKSSAPYSIYKDAIEDEFAQEDLAAFPKLETPKKSIDDLKALFD
ncbi:MAG TPA: hypothetical protein DCW60_03865, partial [Sutterella sp.]|nr:hypothetical protein [Sutterella sp.]